MSVKTIASVFHERTWVRLFVCLSVSFRMPDRVPVDPVYPKPLSMKSQGQDPLSNLGLSALLKGTLAVEFPGGLELTTFWSPGRCSTWFYPLGNHYLPARHN